MSQPHVVVIEDDPTLGELFRMVLEMLPMRHHLCTDAESALDILAREPADVIVTDLLLPGLDGRGLLRRLQQDEALRGSARVVVMSGSVDELVRREMVALGAWRVLAKPVTVKSLIACLKEAAEAPAAPSGASASTAVPRSEAPGEQRALQDHFGGNRELFESYRRMSLQQFERDIVQGTSALERGDSVALRHLAHNLKSVMRTLGQDEASLLALALEDAAQQGQSLDRLRPLWTALSAHLQRIAD